MAAHCHHLKKFSTFLLKLSGTAYLSTSSSSSEYYTVPFLLACLVLLILVYADVCSVPKDRLQNEVQLPHGM